MKFSGRVFRVAFCYLFLAVCVISTSDFCLCFADEASESQQVVEGDDKEAVVSSDEEDSEGFFSFRDPFLSGLPKKVETKIVSMDIQSDTVYEPAEVGPDEFDYSSLTISGLLWGSNKPVAIINGEIMGIGSEIHGATIVRIDTKGILFEYNDKQFLLQRSSG